jgi:hypothetical protein
MAVLSPQGAATCSSGSDPYLISFLLIKDMIHFQVSYPYLSPKLGCNAGYIMPCHITE